MEPTVDVVICAKDGNGFTNLRRDDEVHLRRSYGKGEFFRAPTQGEMILLAGEWLEVYVPPYHDPKKHLVEVHVKTTKTRNLEDWFTALEAEGFKIVSA